jgi:flavin reductase (DIM6/NTAB) family NADH-FMN oxidoreductase RutF
VFPATAAAVFAKLDRELWLVTAQLGDRRGGLIATFVNQASIVPELPRVVVGLAKHHHTWELVAGSGVFALHLLDEEHLDWVWRFGLATGHATDKLAGLEYRRGDTGSPILPNVLAWLDCRVEATLDTGDRTLFLAEVVAGEVGQPGAPLTARRMVQLAPPEQLAALKEQMADDAALDALALNAWRHQRGQS